MAEPKSKYRIQAVAEMTGIPAATLRAWERRYGVPSPMRTESAYRLYSEADVDVIRKLRELTESGMAPAEAARVVQRLNETEAPITPGEDPFVRAQETILEAVENFDPLKLEVAVRRMMFLGSAPTVAGAGIVVPTAATAGAGGGAGGADSGQVSFAQSTWGTSGVSRPRRLLPST